MNILVVNNGYPSVHNPVIYVFVHNQVKELVKNGHRVTVLDIDLRSIRWKRKFGFYKDRYDGIDIYRFSFPFITIGLKEVYILLNKAIALFSIKKILKKESSFHLVHSHFGFGAGNAGAIISKSLKIPLVITEHSTRILYSVSKKQIRHSIEAYRQASKVLAVGNVLMSKLISYGVTDVEYLPNILNTEVFYPRNIEKYCEFTFISVGHLIDRKGHELTIRAIKALHDKGVECSLIIVGKGPDRSRLEKIVFDNKMKNVDFIEKIENKDLPELYSQAHCFVLPSKVETFGVVYAEAIACGIPAISANSGGPSDIINDTNGIIMDNFTLENLIDAMLYMVKNSKKYDKDNLFESIDSRFGNKKFISSINTVYNQLV